MTRLVVSIALGSISLAGSVSAYAQFTPKTPPTEMDLHASYCSEVIEKLDIPYYEKALAALGRPPNPANDEVAASIQSYLNASKAALQKLTLYLAPRVLNDIDPVGLAVAQVSADEDINRIQAAISSCSPQCTEPSPSTECMNECGARKVPDIAVIQNKFKACRDLGWFPF
jgi:hypothetical protein